MVLYGGTVVILLHSRTCDALLVYRDVRTQSSFHPAIAIRIKCSKNKIVFLKSFIFLNLSF